MFRTGSARTLGPLPLVPQKMEQWTPGSNVQLMHLQVQAFPPVVLEHRPVIFHIGFFALREFVLGVLFQKVTHSPSVVQKGFLRVFDYDTSF